jgi:Holliday junction resolvase
MARTPESVIKAAVVKLLKKHGAYYFFPATGGYGRSGVPDIIVCFKGRFIGIECKAGDNTPTALQQRELMRIIDAGGSAFVVNEESLSALVDIFK